MANREYSRSRINVWQIYHGRSWSRTVEIERQNNLRRSGSSPIDMVKDRFAEYIMLAAKLCKK